MTVEYRLAEGQIDRLPTLVADLLRASPAVIAARRPAGAAGGQGGDKRHPDRFLCRRRPGRDGARRQPQPAGRQSSPG